MKTETEIKKRLEWILKAIDDEDNQSEIQQIKLYAELNLLKWIMEVK